MDTTDDASPAERVSTPVDGVDVLGALSPSRAADFVRCPLAFRFRTIDKLPEPPSPDAMRGTVVHQVLEDLFDLPSGDRTPEHARAMLQPVWDAILAEEPEAAAMFGTAPQAEDWLASCAEVLERYFTLEDPRRLEPAEREVYVETLLESKLLLRGFVDRVDIAPDGAVRIVDYKGLALGTRLPTPTGWSTMGEIDVGDEVLGSDGSPVTVLAKSEVHHRPCYRVSFRDGTSVICDNVHLWRVVSSLKQQRTASVLDADSLYELHRSNVASGRRHSAWVEAAQPVEGTTCDSLPIAPWVLGAWLGDGDSRAGGLTVGRADLADMLALAKEHWPREVRTRSEPSAERVTFSAIGDRCTYGHSDFRPPTPGHNSRRCAHEDSHARLEAWNVPLSRALGQSGLIGNKHIPAIYLRAGIDQRIDLLRGLMDTDGWWNRIRRRAGFTTTSDRLASDVIELLHTLGVHPMHFVKPYLNAVRPGRNWHVIEFTPQYFNPFSLPRKAAPCEAGVTALQRRLAARRVISEVEPIASEPTQCIAVDAADSLYLCGDGFIPTHNTGRAPGAGFEAGALFQMKFYALVWWRLHGVLPSMLQLVYLGSGEIVRYSPDAHDLEATRRKIEAIWAAIEQARKDGDWQPSPSRLCDWCSHHALCPAKGGTPPPLPDPAMPVVEQRST